MKAICYISLIILSCHTINNKNVPKFHIPYYGRIFENSMDFYWGKFPKDKDFYCILEFSGNNFINAKIFVQKYENNSIRSIEYTLNNQFVDSVVNISIDKGNETVFRQDNNEYYSGIEINGNPISYKDISGIKNKWYYNDSNGTIIVTCKQYLNGEESTIYKRKYFFNSLGNPLLFEEFNYTLGTRFHQNYSYLNSKLVKVEEFENNDTYIGCRKYKYYCQQLIAESYNDSNLYYKDSVFYTEDNLISHVVHIENEGEVKPKITKYYFYYNEIPILVQRILTLKSMNLKLN